jgi:hypothetical protein
VCTVTETGTGGADPVVVDPSSVTISRPGQQVSVQVTNTFTPVDLQIVKELAGPGGSLVPTGTEFTAQVSCTFDGPRGVESVFNDVVPFSVDEPGVVPGLPSGSVCDVTELQTNGAAEVTTSPPNPVLVTGGPDDPPVVVTVENVFEAGLLTVEKALDGPGAEFVPAGTAFEVEVSCGFAGSPVDGFDPEVLSLTAGEQVEVGPLPAGAVCTVTETEDNGAQGVAVSPEEVVVEGSIEEPYPSVAVTVTNTFDTGELLVEKVLDGPGADAVPAGTEFVVEIACRYLGTDLPVQSVTLVAPDGLTATVAPLPIGAECTLTETEQAGASAVQITPNPATVEDAARPVEVTVANTYPAGSLVIEKVIEGPADLVEGSFDFEVACSFLGADLPVEQATITPPASSVTVNGLPVGAECSVTELAPYGGADGPGVVDPGSVEIAGEEAVTVMVTNTYTPPVVPPEPPQPPVTGATMPVPLLGIAGLAILGGAVLVRGAYRRDSSTNSPAGA